jgi:tetratricopeptide (TPR) repeat protein
LPAENNARAALGFALLRSGHFEEAEKYLTEAAKAHPQNGLLWAGLANVRLALGDKEEATPLLRRALAAEWPASESAGRRKTQITLGRLLAESGKRTEAIASLLSVIEQSGDNASIGKQAAEAIREFGTPEQTEAAYKALSAHFPADPAVEREVSQIEDVMALDPTAHGLRRDERARRWDLLFSRVLTAAAPCMSGEDLAAGTALSKQPARTVQIQSEKARMIKGIWKSVDVSCRGDAALGYLIPSLGE